MPNTSVKKTPSATSPRVVIDTNVFVSALVFGGTPKRVTDMIPLHMVSVVMSVAIMDEVRRIVLGKFPDYAAEAAQLEALLRELALWVPLGSVTLDASRDPDDNRVLETAVIGGAEVIVSGDKDLLVLNPYAGIRILTAGEFLAR